ncbi:hypothetical protein JMJ77_0007221, partial [Colletotrichum scovillei]
MALLHFKNVQVHNTRTTKNRGPLGGVEPTAG